MSPQHKKKPKSASAESKLRIIGGQWRGRSLPFPEIEGLRPSGSRVRETLFNWLMPVLPGSRCLDLYAGSGALGFEALSRGASHCQMIELDQSAAQQLSLNARTLKAETAQIIQGSALKQLVEVPPKRYDIVFLDPPFAQKLWLQTADLLENYQWLKKGAYIYVEMPSQAQLVFPEHWKQHRQKKAGQVTYSLYQKQ